MDLVFGWRTATLTVAAAILLPLAGALWRSLRNRVAARTLAMCLVAMVGVFTPWLIGFAGFYDRWRWLTFLPVSNALLVPPLLYLHAVALTEGRWPRNGAHHLLPGAVQFTWQAGSFLLPMPLKDHWADMSLPVSEPLVALLLAASFVGYGAAGRRRLRAYRAALAGARSDDALFAAEWLQRAGVAFTSLAIVWAGYLIADAIRPLGYTGLMPLYIAIAGFALYLGIAGWRYLAIGFPTLAELAVAAPPVRERDWAALGTEWARRTREAGWHRRESLTLRQLADLIGTNTGYLSRALNEGLGLGFSDFVNGLRCEEVAAAIEAGDARPLLTLALDAGFASKASFNRCFRQRFGVAPSAWRLK